MIELDKVKEASRSFGAMEITRHYLESDLIPPEVKITLKRLQDDCFKGKGIGR